jgi:hypothetical protein
MLISCAMPTEASDFHLEEYRALRKEIEWLLQDYRALERNIAVVCGGLLTWLFAHPWDVNEWKPQDLAWIVPFLFAGLGSVRAWGIFKAFNVYHEYIVKIEDAFATGMDLGGWEHFLNRRTEKDKDQRHTIGTAKFAYMFWGILDAVTFLVALLFAFHLLTYLS